MGHKVVTAPTGGYLEAVRGVLEEADDALLCVAFARPAGVHLLGKELKALGRRGRARVVVTTTLGMSTNAALNAITEYGAELKILNPGGATYHPKVYLGRRGDRVRAVIGSANLTPGLVANVEAGIALDGHIEKRPIAELWDWAEEIWNNSRTQLWRTPQEPAVDEQLDPELWPLIAAVLRAHPTLYTLGRSPQPNFVREAGTSGVLVDTQRSRFLHAADGRGPSELVPAWMFNLAWETLRARGRLSNRDLLNNLRVHRSSAVCAILALLPGVHREPGPEIVLKYDAHRAPTDPSTAP